MIPVPAVTAARLPDGLLEAGTGTRPYDEGPGGLRGDVASNRRGRVGRATVLVVDGERKIRELVRSYLEAEGCSVVIAETGQGRSSSRCGHTPT